MKTIATADGNQVIITTHNPQFLSRNIEDLPSLARLCKVGPKSTIKQISQKTLQSILATNQQDLEKWRAVGIPIQPDDLQIDMECVKYALWLNPYRCSAFFANKILLVEGATEAALISCMLSEGFIPNPGSSIFVFDSIGKYNIHRFMNLFGEFGISHAVLYDHDNGTQATLQIEKTIKDSRNPFTIGIDFFDKDLEAFLGISPSRRDRKPQHVMWHVKQGKIDSTRLSALASKVQTLLQI
jgi:putative ATP-dependent endonuclease of OLD family